MKAPDKIYLPKEEIEERKPWIETAYDPNWDECYIHKDTLMELIKEESKFWDDGEMIFRGLIDQLNSM